MSFISETISWVRLNWAQVVEAYLMLIGAASIIVKLTPWVADDDALKWIMKLMGKYIALNKTGKPPDA